MTLTFIFATLDTQPQSKLWTIYPAHLMERRDRTGMLSQSVQHAGGFAHRWLLMDTLYDTSTLFAFIYHIYIIFTYKWNDQQTD